MNPPDKTFGAEETGEQYDPLLQRDVDSDDVPNVTDVFNPTGMDWSDYTPDISQRARDILLKPYAIIIIILAFLAISSNVLSLLALTQVRTPIGSYFKLLMSLAISDILMGLTLFSHFLNKVFNPVWPPGFGPPALRLRSRCFFMVIKALSNTALNSTALNLMVMALDHYIAILRPLHYHMFVNNRRRYMVIVALWIFATFFGFSDFIFGLGAYKSQSYYNYCEQIWNTDYHEEYITLALAVICLCTMSFIYIRIYIVVRQQQTRDRQQSLSCELKNNKKALVTTLLILGCFMICWLPICLLEVSLMIQVQVNTSHVESQFELLYKMEMYMQCLLYLNTILDPIIYATRMREVRHGYYYLFWNCCKCLHKGRMARRYSMSSNTHDFNVSGSSMRRMSTVSQRRASILTNDSSHMPHSISVQSSQSVPMLQTVLEADFTSALNQNGIGLRNGISHIGNGVLKHSDSNSSGSLRSALKENSGSGPRVHYDDTDSGCHSNGSLKGQLIVKENSAPRVHYEDTVHDHSNGSLKGPLIPKENNGPRVHYEDEAIEADETNHGKDSGVL